MKLGCRVVQAGPVGGVDCACEAVLSIVGCGETLFVAVNFDERQYGAKDLFLRNDAVGGHVRDDGRLNEISACLGFDGFAASFERELLGIGYCGPRLMAEAFARILPVPAADRAVLDAGCGTGLCAPELRPWARTLTGVDVSPAMLEHARRRALYDTLVAAELSDYLPAHADTFDLIAAADVLCYFGDLESVIAGLSAALRRDGALAFTVEQAPDPDRPFALAAHGRYLHGETALRATLARHGLTAAHLWVANLRDEDGRPSPNLVVLAIRGRLARPK